MVEKMKKISVIVPVYNVSEYIQECIESIQKQTYKNIEILAVNDGSTDCSKEILEKMSEEDSRIHVLNKVNGGLSDARNYGILHATGEYLAFIDGDDFISPEMIEKLLNSCISNQCDLSVCDMDYVFDNGLVKHSNGGEFHIGDLKLNPKLVLINNSACNKLYKKTLFDDIKFPVGRYYEDLAIIPTLLFKANFFSKVNEPLYHYRQRSGSIAHTANMKIFDIYQAIEDNIHYINQSGNHPELIEELKHLFVIHGLDLTTLRIKDFDNKEIRITYLIKNMEYLKKYYPEYEKDSAYKEYSFKKKIIFFLMKMGRFKEVLRIYDK